MANIGSAARVPPLWKPASQWINETAEPKFPALSIPALSPFAVKYLARGSIVQIYGVRSSGRTGMSLHILAQATQRGEFCAVVDLYDTFAPGAATSAGVRLDRLLWVRCRGNGEHAIKAADLLLHAGGFGVVLLDLCDAAPRVANRIPLSYWFRFQRAVRDTATILLLCGDHAYAQACSSTTLELEPRQFCWTGQQPFLVLHGISANATLSNGNDRPSTAGLQSVA